jgi:hypothetical protein
MKKDFHYYCIGVLARAAGFRPNDALTIAYASQYVDDATESEPIQVGDIKFDPVRTAHIGLKAYDWSVQKRVYIPFHFLPPMPFRSPDNFTFITKENSKFAKMIWEEAINEPDKKFRLVRIGLALHTIADSWSHKLFSGRENNENDVENIHIWEDDEWKHLKLENLYLDLLPQIGHAEAGTYPDRTNLKWKYLRHKEKEHEVRHNSQDFFKAAKVIYDMLCNAKKHKQGKVTPWDEIKGKIQDLFNSPEEDLSKHCNEWRRAFPKLLNYKKFKYSSKAWREEALEPKKTKDIEWDKFHPSEFKSLRFKLNPGFPKSSWVQFHRAALKQRHFVLENLI